MAQVSDIGQVVRASAAGDQAAWNELVRRYAPLVLAVTRNYRLTDADAQDVSQTVWLRLVEHLADLREPEALPGWLATTTARECLRQIRRTGRLVPVESHQEGAIQNGVMQQGMPVDLEADVLRSELRQALRDGLDELPARDQQLLSLRSADPPMTYQEISLRMDMPIGSIGPTLRRSLDRLRESRAMQAYMAVTPTAERGPRR